ncbi:MAG: dTMP kinase [Fibrobacteria bacterium]|nr:dTMP kinase [Fibrobacteria bacterium]
MSGLFISLEGIDGCGKSTQVKLLTSYLEEKGLEVLHIREPGGCAVSEQIRDILLQKKNSQMVPDTELLLYWAARAQLTQEVIAPALKKDNCILADRFGWSTFAYQGYGRGMDLEAISFLQKFSCGSIWPHHSFLLDISVEAMQSRLATTGAEPDRMESQGDAFFERTRAGYLELAKQNSHSFTVLNGLQDKNNLQQQIREVIQRIIAEKS